MGRNPNYCIGKWGLGAHCLKGTSAREERRDRVVLWDRCSPVLNYKKCWFMIVPFLFKRLAWAGLFAFATLTVGLAWDLKQPLADVSKTCTVLGTGLNVSVLQKQHAFKPLFQVGHNPVHRLAFECPQWGHVLVNDPDAFRYSLMKAGQQATIRHRDFRWAPDQWQIQVASSPIAVDEVATSTLGTR